MKQYQANKIYSQLYAGIIRSLLLSIVLTIFTPMQTASADKSRVDVQYKALVIIDKENNAHLDFIGSISNRLKKQAKKRIETIVYTIEEIEQFIQKNNRMPDANIIIPVGFKAALSIQEHHPKIPVYFTLITSAKYQMIKNDLRNNNFIPAGFSGIYVDHPTEKHLSFIHHALPEINEACMITSHFSVNKNTSYAIKLSLDVINNKDDLHSRLSEILSQCDALLSSPDPVIYNNGSIRNILLTAYKHGAPVIGYSKALVKAGALMALYTSPKQLGTEVGEILIGLLDASTKSLPEPKSPKYFSIEFNYWVAEALKLELPDKEELIKALSRDFNKSP